MLALTQLVGVLATGFFAVAAIYMQASLAIVGFLAGVESIRGSWFLSPHRAAKT
jgi:hypothetical protein